MPLKSLSCARCPWCLQGTLRIIAAITHGEVIRKILRHLKLSADPPPIAPVRVRQEAFAWSLALTAPGVSQPHPGSLARGCHTALVLVLRRRCPLSRPVGGEAWPFGVSVLYGHTLYSRLALHDRARYPLLCLQCLARYRPATASPREPEGGNQPMATIPDVCHSLCGLSWQRFVASLRTACQAQATTWVLARLGVVPGGAGWATGWARAGGEKAVCFS